MKNSKAIMLAIFTSAFVVLTVVNMSLASTKAVGENTLDMLEIMTRAFDESGGEGTGQSIYMVVTSYTDVIVNMWEYECGEGKVKRCTTESGKMTVICQPGGNDACSPISNEAYSFTYCSACIDPAGF
jgi:hypothetical protein